MLLFMLNETHYYYSKFVDAIIPKYTTNENSTTSPHPCISTFIAEDAIALKLQIIR
jgi:hypothetical protein